MAQRHKDQQVGDQKKTLNQQMNKGNYDNFCNKELALCITQAYDNSPYVPCMTVFHLSVFSLMYLIDISESLNGELLQEFSSHFLFPKQNKG